MSIEIIIRDGKQWAVLPYEEYKALTIGKEDSVSIPDLQKQSVAGRIPPAVQAILDTQAHPITAWRKYRGHSMRKLSKLVDVTTAHMSQIESRKRNASLKLLCKIAEVLEADINMLIDGRN